MDNEPQNIPEPAAVDTQSTGGRKKFSVMLFPLIIAIYFMAGFTQLRPEDKSPYVHELDTAFDVTKKSKIPKINFAALLANEEFSQNLRDTVYTDKDKYLELRIDEQVLYVHYRDGRVKEYPVSSGNKFLSKGIESRPGLFAIFMKEELHLSSQFNDAKMYYYMPYNMGIGFHGLGGTGYYGNLGIRPSSHGCIRMRTADAKELFNQCDVGTLVLSHRGESARVVAFAPEGFKNDWEYSKDEYMEMLAYNLNSIYEGKYFVKPPKRFVIDGTIIPKIGYNVGKTDDISSSQYLPLVIEQITLMSDKLEAQKFLSGNIQENPDREISEKISFDEESNNYSSLGLDVTKEQIDKLAFNRIGILPYFPPNK